MRQPNIEMGYVLHLKPVGKPQVLMWTFGGMIGYHGMNGVGVAHFANSLGGGPPGRFALPHYPVKRLMLESSTFSEVLDILDRVPLASNGNYVACDGAGKILDIEATTAGALLLEDDGAGFLAHTNHFLCPPHANQRNYDKSLPDSFQRLSRMNEMIRAESGSVTVASIKRFLSDHSDHPTSICRHAPTSDRAKAPTFAGRTVASMIAEPARRRMHVALGNPCESRFVTYSMDG
jgi:isopenicillin-N N-acyltransferase-like protein